MPTTTAQLGPATAKRAVFYLRVSTGQQAEQDLSIPDQRRHAQADWEACGYQAGVSMSIAFREIAKRIGRKLGLPVEARDPDHFGWFAGFAGADMPASSARTREVLGWEPTGPGLLADIEQPDYDAAA